MGFRNESRSCAFLSPSTTRPHHRRRNIVSTSSLSMVVLACATVLGCFNPLKIYVSPLTLVNAFSVRTSRRFPNDLQVRDHPMFPQRRYSTATTLHETLQPTDANGFFYDDHHPEVGWSQFCTAWIQDASIPPVQHWKQPPPMFFTNNTVNLTTNRECLLQEFYKDPHPYINLRQRGSSEWLDKTKYSSFGQLESYIQSGGSAVICLPPTSLEQKYDNVRTSSFHLTHQEQLQQLQSKVVSDLSLSNGATSVNIYHSGPRAVALNRHYDRYHVLVLQLEGQKDWEVAIPEAATEITTSMFNNYTTAAAEIWTNITMTPGDVLFLPQGVWHAATTSEGFPSSTHATVGLLSDPPNYSKPSAVIEDSL